MSAYPFLSINGTNVEINNEKISKRTKSLLLRLNITLKDMGIIFGRPQENQT